MSGWLFITRCNRYCNPLWDSTNLDFGDLDLRLGVENRYVVAIRIADGNVFSVWRKGHPIRTVARHQASRDFMCLEVIDVHAIIQQAGHPHLGAIGSERQSVRVRVRSFELTR